MINLARYETDVVVWANEQAALLRSGRFSELDIENIAEEIEDVGKSEQRELASRMAVLLMHLLKWQYQPSRRGSSWIFTIRAQRGSILMCLEETPSLRGKLTNEKWISSIWNDALYRAVVETELDIFPAQCPWAISDILSEDWLPEDLP